jgi:glucosamine-6-phosphate deaminase
MFAGTNCKQLSENTIIANSRFFGGDLSQVPKKAMTIGIRTLMESAEVMIMVMGDKKALALQQCMEGAISQAWPITALQMHTNAIIVADEAACGELKMKTYRYFTELEDEYTHIGK